MSLSKTEAEERRFMAAAAIKVTAHLPSTAPYRERVQDWLNGTRKRYPTSDVNWLWAKRAVYDASKGHK